MYYGNARGGDDDAGVSLYLPPPYDGLDKPSTRKQLGLSEAQETRLQAIATKFAKAAAELQDELWELNKLTPEEQARRNSEIMPVYREEQDTATRQIAALLTPKQAAALPEIDFRDAVIDALSNPRVQKDRRYHRGPEKPGRSGWPTRIMNAKTRPGRRGSKTRWPSSPPPRSRSSARNRPAGMVDLERHFQPAWQTPVQR